MEDRYTNTTMPRHCHARSGKRATACSDPECPRRKEELFYHRIVMLARHTTSVTNVTRVAVPLNSYCHVLTYLVPQLESVGANAVFLFESPALKAFCMETVCDHMCVSKLTDHPVERFQHNTRYWYYNTHTCEAPDKLRVWAFNPMSPTRKRLELGALNCTAQTFSAMYHEEPPLYVGIGSTSYIQSLLPKFTAKKLLALETISVRQCLLRVVNEHCQTVIALATFEHHCYDFKALYDATVNCATAAAPAPCPDDWTHPLHAAANSDHCSMAASSASSSRVPALPPCEPRTVPGRTASPSCSGQSQSSEVTSSTRSPINPMHVTYMDKSTIKWTTHSDDGAPPRSGILHFANASRIYRQADKRKLPTKCPAPARRLSARRQSAPLPGLSLIKILSLESRTQVDKLCEKEAELCGRPRRASSPHEQMSSRV